MRGRQLYLGLTGCLPGVQHFKLCEPRAVTENSLRCKQCASVVAELAGTDQQVLWASEQQLAGMLYRLG
jgi:hypothetical protein